MAAQDLEAREYPLPRPTVPSEDYAYAAVIELERIAAALEYITNSLKKIEQLLHAQAEPQPEPEPKPKPKRG